MLMQDALVVLCMMYAVQCIVVIALQFPLAAAVKLLQVCVALLLLTHVYVETNRIG